MLSKQKGAGPTQGTGAASQRKSRNKKTEADPAQAVLDRARKRITSSARKR